MQQGEKLGEADTSAKSNRAALVSDGTSDAKMRAADQSSRPNSKLHGGNFELEMESIYQFLCSLVFFMVI